MIHEKHIKLIDLALVVLTLGVLIGAFFFFKPTIYSPINGYVTQGPVLFSFEKGERILIDDNLEFSSPQIIVVSDSLVINLQPGTYYWKIEGTLVSEIRTLTIESVVDLQLRDAGDSYEVVNYGNTRLKVDKYESSGFAGNVVLEPDESIPATATTYVGGEAHE